LTDKISFKKSVSKDLKKLGKAEANRLLEKISTDLPKIADSCPLLKGKFTGLRKYRVGEYQVIFYILDDILLIVRIGHRRDVNKGQ
jgi:mRNA interferase RelE/StbE